MLESTLHPASATALSQLRSRFALALGLFTLSNFSACHRPGTVESKIVALIHECPTNTACQVSLHSATGFDFDTMYVFDLDSNAQDRARILGVKDEGFEEIQRQLVFLKAGKIVHQENEPTNFERIVKNQVIFDPMDGRTILSFTPDAVFSAHIEQSHGNPYFVLQQIKSNLANHP